MHHHALHLYALDAEDAVALGHDVEATLAGLALVLPDMIVLHVLLGRRTGRLAQVVHLRGNGRLQRVDALARQRADAIELRVDGAVDELVATSRGNGILAHASRQGLAGLFRSRHVDLVRYHDAGPLGQVVSVHFQLIFDDLVILQGIATLVVARQVDNLHNKRRALNVAQELMAQAAPLMGALNKTGNVGHHKGKIARRSYAQVGHECGEGIVGNFRTGRAHLRDERTFARTGHAHQGRIGHELHFQFDPALLSRLAQLGEGRSTTGGGDEVDVAATAHAAASHHHGLAVMGEVGDHLAHLLLVLEVLVDHRAHRHLEHQVLAGSAVHAAALAVGAALSLEVVLEAVLDQRGHAGVGLHHHVAAMAAVAAVGTALRHVGLATKRHAASAAIAALHIDSDFIDKHMNLS